MKKTLFVFTVVCIVAIPLATYAFGGIVPFGGRIVLTHQPPNVVCPGDPMGSPFTIVPVSKSSPVDWSTSLGFVNVGLVAPTGWILGLYRPAYECVMGTGFTGGTPYPTFQTDFYGTSIPKPLPR
jgi:hypothetical protein